MNIPEPDWRRFRETHPILLQRYCSRILDELVAVAQGTHDSPYERYLKIRKLTKDRGKQLANAFDDFRRSTAVNQLGMMRWMGLLTDEELAGFSEETRQHVENSMAMATRLSNMDADD